jgi:hypothetical protein
MAALTVEDTELLHRLYKRKVPIVIKLEINGVMKNNLDSRNAGSKLKY